MITCCDFRKFKPIIFWCIFYFKNVIVDCNVVADETLYCCRSKFKNLRKAIVSYWPNLWFEKNCTHESLNHSVTNTFFLTEYEYRILFGFQTSPNTKYYSILRKFEYQVQIALFGLTFWILITKYWIDYTSQLSIQTFPTAKIRPNAKAAAF